MPTSVFQLAARITTVLSLCSFLAALYVWLQSRKTEKSILSTIRGQGIVHPESVVKILTQFSTTDARLEALKQMLGYDQQRAAGVMAKIGSNIDLNQFSATDSVRHLQLMVGTGCVLLLFGGLAAFKSEVAAPSTERSASRNSVAASEHEHCQEFSIYFSYSPEKAYRSDSLQYLDWDDQPRSVKYSSHLRIRYKEWADAPWEAAIQGSAFVHAPSGDAQRAHSDSVIRYLSWDHQPMTATLLNCNGQQPDATESGSVTNTAKTSGRQSPAIAGGKGNSVSYGRAKN